VESRIFESPSEKKVGSKNRVLREVEGNLQCSNGGGGEDFWFELLRGTKNRDSKKTKREIGGSSKNLDLCYS